MEFRLFGAVELRVGEQLLDLGTPRQQAVLVALIVDAPRPVAIESLIDRVWDDNPPVEARNVLYSHLSRIRRLLRNASAKPGGAVVRIERRHAGYVLDVDPDLVDAHRFGRLADRGRDPGYEDADRAAALAEALSLWQGTPLAGVPGKWVEQVRGGWHRRRLDVALQWAQLELRLGRPDAVINAMSDLVIEHPLVEPLEVLLMRALHAAGRGSEAIDRYAVVRHRLAEDLGADPGLELRTLYQVLLSGEPPPAPPALVVAPGILRVSPAQLPPDVYGFTGRDDELHQLDRLLTAASGQSTAAIVAVSGTAGVGKTALAVHWAHRVRAEFPDGQLYINLRGFDPTGSPVTAGEVVLEFLSTFEVPPERIPAGFDAQVGLYRSLLADRRVLVVLDNARDAEQVRPMLPGGPGCAAVVTSRDQLFGLIAEGAHPLTLDLLSAAGARDLLARRLGVRRVAADPHAVDEIATLCARLPLALAVVAARAAIHPGFGLAVLAEELRQARDRLDQLAGADPATDTRAVFSWSYRQLSPAAAKLFRLLGVHPGPAIATPAAASLSGLTVGRVRRLLADLAQAHLVGEQVPGRYAFHDLLRAYAAELSQAIDTDNERQAAMHRVLVHYVHSADVADRCLNPRREEPTPLPPLPPAVTPEWTADREQALAWFNAEYPVLLAAIRTVPGLDADVWQLAWVLRRFFGYQGFWRQSIDALAAALAAAQRLADPLRQAAAHCFLGPAHIRLGQLEQAREHLEAAFDLYREADDSTGQGYAHLYYSWMLERQERHHEALSHAQQSRDFFRAGGHLVGQGKALNAIGWFHALLGAFEDALKYCKHALELQEEVGDRLAQAGTWDSLGFAHSHLGQHGQAVRCYQAAVELYRAYADHYNEANVSASLGDAHYAAGDAESAGSAWRYALDILDRLGHPDADDLRAKMNRAT